MRRYVTHVPLRWSDMDAFGHVNNARFLTLYEEARVAMMFSDDGLPSLRTGVVIARHEIDYMRPVSHGDPVRVELWIDEVRNSAFRVAYEMFDRDVLASRARSVCVPFNLDSARPRRLTPDERAFLEHWLTPPP